MSKAVVLDKEYNKASEVALPEGFSDINPHNLYLYVKSYQAALRANGASAKTRGEVSGGGKKPWSQKGGGRARAGSITSPVFVGGGKAHGPSNNRNYDLKVNKKQKRLAFKAALAEKAANGKLFLVDSIRVESGKTKEANALFAKLSQRSALFVTESFEEKTFLAFRNLKKCYLAEANELNGYVVSLFDCVVCEKSLFEKIVNEG